MKTFALLAATLFAVKAYGYDLGSAIVTNQCAYDVHLWAVPAAGGGFTEQDGVLKTGDSFTQTWTQLSNNAGWAIKLSQSADMSEIMQYEYTYQGDEIIWYDLSDVNGNPWNGDWEITANDAACAPRQAAYRYSTDDAYGMQACAANVTITVTLCSGDDAATSASVSVASPTSTAAPVSSAASSSTQTSTIQATFTSSATTLVTSVVVTSVVPATSTAPASSSIAAASSTAPAATSTAPAASSTAAATTTTRVNSHTWWHHRPTNAAKREIHAHRHPHGRAF